MYISKKLVRPGKFYTFIIVSGLLVYFGALKAALVTDWYPVFVPVVKSGVVIVVEPNDDSKRALALARQLGSKGEVVTLVAEPIQQNQWKDEFAVITPGQWKWLLAESDISKKQIPKPTLAAELIVGLEQAPSIVSTRFGDRLRVIKGP